MDIVTTLILGALVSGITQLMKRVFPEVDPKLWVVLLAFVGAAFYAIVVPLLPLEVVEKAGLTFATAISFYEVLKAFLPKKD